MTFTIPTLKLTHRAAMTMLETAIAKAIEIGWHVNIVIVDASGIALASVRMDDAKFLSMHTATNKAITAASHRRPSAEVDPTMAVSLALASEGRITTMAGGLPVVIDGICIGGVGVGSAPDEIDIAIAEAALAAIGAVGRMPEGSR